MFSMCFFNWKFGHVCVRRAYKTSSEQSYNRTTKHTNNTKPNYQTQNMQTTKPNATLYFTSLLLPDDPPDAKEKRNNKKKNIINKY